jgi:formate dehydrogenase maturation protein FdhE
MKKVVVPPLEQWPNSKNAFALMVVSNLSQRSPSEVTKLATGSPYVVADELSEPNAQSLVERLKKIGLDARVEESDIVACPMCGSRKVVSRDGGLLGLGKTKHVCQTCQHKWSTPRK